MIGTLSRFSLKGGSPLLIPPLRTIRLIAKVDGDYRQLDLKDPKTASAVKAVATYNELKTLYTTMGIPSLT